MEGAIFIARIVGPICIVAGLGLLFNSKTYQKVIEDFTKNSALIYLGGFIALLFGLMILQFYSLWAIKWALLITVLGWLSIIKGAVLIISPKMLTKMAESYQKNTAPLIVHAIIVLALGIFLTFKGYLG